MRLLSSAAAVAVLALTTPAFAEEVNTFATAQGAPAEQMAMVMQQIKGIPLKARTEIEAAASAPAAAPTTPQ